MPGVPHIKSENGEAMSSKFMSFSFYMRSVRCVIAVSLCLALQSVPAIGQNRPDDTVRIPTELIQTNVTVTDKNGRRVDGLKPEEFELLVDGAAKPISFFEFVIAGTAEEHDTLSRITVGSSDRPRPKSSSAVHGRTIVFFIDDLHLSLDSLKRTRDSLSYFIDHRLGFRDQVAIVSASGQIGFLQQLTDNRAVLRAAAGRLRQTAYNVLDTEQPTMSEYMALKIEERDRDALSYYIGRCMNDNRGYTPAKCALVVKERSRSILTRATKITDGTFTGFDTLMQSMAAVSGRKLILFISDGFYSSPRDRTSNALSRLDEITDAGRRTGSLIYTIDARGLISGAPDATVNLVDGNGVLDRANIGEIARSQDALNALAVDTGGRATRNTSSITDWVRTTLEETSSYYVLAWQPELDQSGNRFRKVEIRLPRRPDLTVKLPRGYVAGATKKKPKAAPRQSNRKDANITAVDPPGVRHDASPGRLALDLSLKYIDVPNLGGVVTTSVQIHVPVSDAKAGEPSVVDLAGLIFNDQGRQVADFKTGITVENRNPDGEGPKVIYNNRTPLPPGIYQVKVAAKDRRTGSSGTNAKWIEVPDLGRKGLTLGSLFLDFKQATKANNDDNAQIQFSVDNAFRSPLQLSFLSFVYNAAVGADGKANLNSSVEIVDEMGHALMSSPPRSITATNSGDRSRIPVAGEIRQQQLAAGIYLLKLTVTDVVARRSTTATTVFTVQ
jgi:VWFA-related protein